MNCRKQDFAYAFSEFLDTFYLCKDRQQLQECLREEPARIDRGLYEFEFWIDAYLAASAEYLANTYGIPCPVWAHEPHRVLKTAYYDNSGLERLNPILVAESPAAFRKRLIFTEERPLRRARTIYAIERFIKK